MEIQRGYYYIKNYKNMIQFLKICDLNPDDYKDELKKEEENWKENEYWFVWTGASVCWYKKDELSVDKENFIEFDSYHLLRSFKLSKLNKKDEKD